MSYGPDGRVRYYRVVQYQFDETLADYSLRTIIDRVRNYEYKSLPSALLAAVKAVQDV